MSPETIKRPIEEYLTPDLSETDLSKVDTFSLGVILVNMLTGSFLFESCTAQEYQRVVTDSEHLLGVLREKLPVDMPEEELRDLTTLL